MRARVWGKAWVHLAAGEAALWRSGPRHTATEGSFSETPAEYLRAAAVCAPARIVRHKVRAYGRHNLWFAPCPNLITQDRPLRLQSIPRIHTQEPQQCLDILSAAISTPEFIDMEKESDRKECGEAGWERERERKETCNSTYRRENVRKDRKREKREREMSLLFTLMLHCSLLRRGRTRGPYHPICCPCLCVSQLISLTKSRIIFQPSFIPSLSLPLPVCRSLYLSLRVRLALSLSYISATSLLPSMFEKGA